MANWRPFKLRSTWQRICACCALSLAILVTDLLTPLGFASGILYVVVVWLSLGFKSPRAVYATATVCAILTLVGAAISPAPAPVAWQIVIANRLMAITLIYFIAYLLLKLEQGRNFLELNNLALTDQVQERSRRLSTAERAASRAADDQKRIEAEWDRFFQASLDMLCVASLDGYFQRVNPSFERVLGYKRSELLAKPFLDFVHPDDRAATIAVLGGLERGQDTLHFENRYRCSDGTYKWLEWSCPAPQPGETSLYAVAKEVTQRRQTEDLLRQMIEASPAALLLVDRFGKLVVVNAEAAKLFGYAPNELLGKEIETLIPEEFRDNHRAHVEGFFAKPVPRPIGRGRDLWGRKKNGESIPVEIGLSPLFLEIGPVVLVGVLDITERRIAIEAISKAKEAAEAANRAKSDFLANMSHEIRTPMNAVNGLTELVLESDLDETQRGYLSMVMQSGESLLTTINEILDFSKIEAGKMEIESADFDVWDLVGDALKSLAPRAHAKDLELAYHIGDDVPEWLVGDPVRLRQVLINLVGNSIKFTPRGEVLVEVALQSYDWESVHLRFAVTDTGIGIPPDKQKLIFEAFSQADSSTTRRFGGTGLGLAISSRLVGLMGGQLEVHSELGKGSTFSFQLRLGRSKNNVSPDLPAPTMSLQGKPVLIVDDNSTNRKILQQMVGSWGMLAQSVQSAAEAIELYQTLAARSQPLPLLLTDVQMPDMDGITMVETIRADGRFSEVPIIVMTSGDPASESSRWLPLRIAARFLKPVKQTELKPAIENALATTQTASEPTVIPADEDAPKIKPLNILLVEDGLMNQKIALALLEKWGHRVTIANNGREALTAFASNDFDLILMDVQMPEMDGFEATRAIRAREQETGGHIPIVAMTARAMMGDREKCLQSGMDSYVSKPIRRRELYGAIAPFFAAQHEGTEQTINVNWSNVLQLVNGDRQIIAELIDTYRFEVPKLVASIESAARARDAKALRLAAHTLKGSMRLFGVASVSSLVEAIESQGESGVLDNLEHRIDELRVQLKRLDQALDSFKP